MPSKLKKEKGKRGGKNATPPNFNQPAFSATSSNREVAKKKVRLQLQVQGITGADQGNAMTRGKLTLDSAGNYTFRTDAYSKADG